MYRRFQILIGLGLLALSSWLFTACRGDEIVYPTIGTHVTDEVRKGGLYVLCEGNMGSNKARLDYINLHDGDYYANWYGAMNPKQMKELGDVGNDIQQYGGRLYAVINCSHKVEVMDLKGRHIAKVDISNCRYMAFKGDKMYVSAYVGSVADPDMLGSVYEVDTATLTVTREVKVGHQPDELCVVGNRLYVANSGGYLTNRYDSTLSVIDLTTFTETQQIVVGLNPTRVRVDDKNHLWVCCQGNYKDIQPQVVVHDLNSVIKRIPTPCANISIYGVPNWQLRGLNVKLNRQPSGQVFYGVANYYDQVPEFHHPTLVTEAKNFDKDNFFTWSEYKDAHLIKPVPDGTMAMWLTPEATYVAISTEMNWRREYFGRGGNTILIDKSGHQYKCKDVMDYPNDKLFWVQGYSGDYFAIVLIFEPLPLNLETITYIVPEGEPFKANFANWSGEVKPNLSVRELRDNQKLFKYFPRKMVE